MNTSQAVQVMFVGLQVIFGAVNVATGIDWFFLLNLAMIVFHSFMFRVFASRKPVIESAPVSSKVISKKEKPKKVSWPGQQVLDAYAKLPEENKAMGDLRMTIEALDVAHNHPSVINRHFQVKNSSYKDAMDDWHEFGYMYNDPKPDEFFPFWCSCKKGDCPMPEYREFCDAIDAILNRLADQKAKLAEQQRQERRALELAGVEAEIENLPMIMAALRKEADIVQSISDDL